MAASIIGAILGVNGPAAFAEHRTLASPTLEKCGGPVVAGGAKIEVAHGDWSPIRIAVLEFENIAKAKEWGCSSDYYPLASHRTTWADGGVIFVNGD